MSKPCSTIENRVNYGLPQLNTYTCEACGGGDEDAAQRSIESLKFAGDAVTTDTETLCNLLT